ncbi:MAG: NAD(P)H-dependent flavin oxidoreductase [Gammaproteobacteria bacterium]
MSLIHEKLNIRVPIWNAGMGIGIAGARLTAGVSNARGLGVLGAGGLSSAEIQAQILDVRRLTSRAFGVNIILPLLASNEIETCFDERVPLMVLFWGDVSPYIKDAHRRDILVIAQCGDAEDATAAADAGVDGIIIQGTEAGGHVKASTTLKTNLAQTLKAVAPLPVIAAGGIATGQGIADALLEGASAASIGTRFLATEEALVTNDYKQRVINAQAKDTVLTELFDMGWPNAQHRVIRNRTYQDWEQHGSAKPGTRRGENESIGFLTVPDGRQELPRYTIFPPVPNVAADPDDLALYAGESCEQVNDLLSVANLMENLQTELRAAMA